MNTLKNTFAFLTLLLLFASCSSDDDNSNQSNNVGNQFPLTLANYWNYDVTNRNLNTNQTQLRRDSLYVATNTADNFTLAVDGIANGTMNTVLTQTTLSRTNSRLLGTGSIIFPFEGLEDFEITVNNAVFYDLNASVNAELSSITGTITETIDNLPVTATYTMRTIQGPFSESITLQNETYTNVTNSSIVLELTMTTQVEIIPGSIVDIVILDTQNVLGILNYYAEDIGLVRSETQINYQLEDFSQIGITLPFPETLDATSLQELDTYAVAEE